MEKLPSGYDAWRTRGPEDCSRLAERVEEAASEADGMLSRALELLPRIAVRVSISDVSAANLDVGPEYDAFLTLRFRSSSIDGCGVADDLSTWLEMVAKQLRIAAHQPCPIKAVYQEHGEPVG